jgi:succinate dehydrogenase flavin-adding protein (antitoxin of CptAB toxin-antitoxin module)
MKELDLILLGWLERRYAGATPEERQLFAQFLELPDPVMADYLLGSGPPGDPALSALVSQLVSSQSQAGAGSSHTA